MAKRKASHPEINRDVVKYEPTEPEREARRKLKEAATTALPAPRIKVVDGKWGIDHTDSVYGLANLMASMGTNSYGFSSTIIGQLINAVSKGQEVDQEAVNFALSVIAGVKPKDELETMLAAQMAAVHMATMTFSRRLAHVETIQQLDSNERALNKLARTFSTQMEALKRYRTGGEQKVTVHHVTVNEGGQAIVGTVEQTTGGEGGRQPK